MARVAEIWWRCPRGPDHEWRASPNNRTSGRTGCPFCAGRKVSVTNSLATLRPDLAKQWHFMRNGELVPERIVAGSTRRVWWKCTAASDHEWRVSPHDRVNLEGGCPFCLCMRVCSSNSLAATRPRIAAEWHPKKNLHLTARDVVPGSGLRVWWRCKRHAEHEWRASVSNRVLRRSKCPFCSGSRASAQHCLAVAHPAIAREWHPTRNGALTPEAVTPRARRSAWWLCSGGHEWRMPVSTRTRRRSPCPACSGRLRVGARVSSPERQEIHRTSASRDLREEHRRLEQILTLLAAERTVDPSALSRFAADLTAHLEAEASVFYPAVERALNRPLTTQRSLHARLRLVLSATTSAFGDDDAFRSDRLRELRAVFQEVSRFEERVALPALESVMAEEAIEALWQRVRAARSDVLLQYGKTTR